MKNISLVAVLLMMTLSSTSCREKSEKEKLVEEMKEEGAVIEVNLLIYYCKTQFCLDCSNFLLPVSFQKMQSM